MSTLLKYPEKIKVSHAISHRELRQLDRVSDFALTHDSGGSYSMAALMLNPKPIDMGYNNLFSPAQLKYAIYPEISGMHAELQVCVDNPANAKDSSIFIAGRIISSGSKMSSTLPCHICAEVLVQHRVKWIYAYHKTRPIKIRPEELLTER